MLLLVACKKAGENSPPPPTPGSGSGSNAVAPVNANDDALIAEAKKFVADMQPELTKLMVDASQAAWNNETDITPAHEEAASKASAEAAKGQTRLIKAAAKF